jgi:hypothetical protein
VQVALTNASAASVADVELAGDFPLPPRLSDAAVAADGSSASFAAGVLDETL